MRGWLRLRGWALLIGAFILGAVGIIYAVEIQRGIGASAVVGEVQTVEDTILVWNQIDPNQQPLIDLEFGTADVNAFGLFKAISTVPVFVENGGDVSFELRVQATDVKINGSAVGDVLALDFVRVVTAEIVVEPGVEPGSRPLAVDLGPPPVAINDATSALLIGTDGLPRTLTTRTEIIRVPPAATAFSELPVVATIRPGQVVAFEAGLRFLESPQALGVEPEDRVTFTALFRAEGPVLPEPPDPKFVDPFELAQKYGDRPRRGGVMKGSVVENYPHFDFNQGFSSDIIGLSGLYNGLLMRNPYDYREILPDLAYA